MTLAFIPPSLATSVRMDSRMDSSVVMRATPPDQVREALPAQQVPHLAMRPGDGKPNALALQRRVQLPQHPDRGQIEVGRG